MDRLQPPRQLCVDSGNLSKSWKSWREEFMLYVDLTVDVDVDEKTKVKLFSYLVGETGRELLDTLMGEAAKETWKIRDIVAAFDAHCNPSVNETVERYRFFSRNQGSSENIDCYVTELKLLAKTCNFGPLRDSLIRDRIVCGSNSNGMRERLLREKNLTLDTCVQLCRAAELSRENAKTISGPTMEEVHAVQRPVLHKQAVESVDCKFCGKLHEKSKQKCPAYGKKCKKCGKENHFAAKCKASQMLKGKEKRKKQVHNVAECNSDELEDILCVTASETETVSSVGSDKRHYPQLFAGMLVGKRMVKFQIDCGATCNIIPINLLDPNTKIENTKSVLVMYNKSKLKPLGRCKLKLRNPRNQKLYQLEFQVVDECGTVPLLGKRASEGMQLIKVHYENIMAIDSIVTAVAERQRKRDQWTIDQIKAEYADVFMGDGCLEGEYSLEIDDTVKPVQLPKRRVPVAMMKPLKAELQDLQRRGIIAPVECSTDWINGMVVVKKQTGELRVCIDPRPLNKALKRSHFPLQTIEDILPDLSKAKVFTVCDVKSGFWHVKLDEESSYLTTFATPFGRYRWLRLPMGVSPAPEVFQRKLTQALEDLPGLYIIADDVLITGQGETQDMAQKDHDEKLRLFLTRCRQKNIKLNADKLKLRKKEATYIGHLLTADGLRIDPEKVRAIEQMPKPTDVKAVQRLLGMVNYLAKFCPHLSDHCQPLRQLTHKDCEWKWTDQLDQAFLKLKETITNTPVLKYYSPDEELTVQCDASDTGLGAALVQRGKPIAFASRALTQTERGYAQIEKEFLAMVFSLEKFHQYTYGRRVTVQSDHKPLENIMHRGETSCAALHSSHLGVEGCLRRARECVYWPGINDQIKTYVTKCDICRSVDYKQQKERLISHEIPNRPWAKVGTDLFSFDNKDYLITVDYYSNFWEIDYLSDTKSTTVIRKLKAHFARQGIPDIVISDNGPQYTSQEFQRFSERWEFLHKTSSPGHPQSNGKAESAVKNSQETFEQSQMAGQDPYLALLDHRNTPSQGLDTSPAQRLLSRRTRTLLPTKASLLRPKVEQAQPRLK
ncbi:hypothetical protein NFI96_019030, partial [Prochilodus magdalenae]